MKNKIIRGVKWAFAEQAGVQIISFLVFLLLARVLGPTAFGLIALSQAFVMFITQTVQQGFSTVIIQRGELDDMHVQTAFWSNLILSLVAIIGVQLLAPTIARVFNEPELEALMRVLCVIFVLTPVWTIQQALFRRNLQFKPLAVQSISASMIGNLVAVIMALNGYGVWSLVGREIVRVLVASMLLWRRSDWRPRLQFSIDKFIELWQYSAHVIWGNIILFCSLKADSLIIGFGLGSKELGYYHVAMRLIALLNQLISRTIEKVAMPVFSRLQADIQQLRQAFGTANQYSALIILPVFAGIALTVTEFVPVVFGDRWDPSIPVMQVLLIAGIMQSLIYNNIALVMGLGKPQIRTKIITIEAALKVSFLLLAVSYGLIATAIAVVAVTLITYPIWVFSAIRILQTQMTKFIFYFIPAVTSTLVMAAAVTAGKYFLQGTVLAMEVLLLISVTVGFAAYTLSTLLLFPRLSREIIGNINTGKAK